MQGKGNNDTRISEIDDYLNNTVHGIDILRENAHTIIGIHNLLANSRNKCIFTVGNGGSSSAASHMVNDLMINSRFKTICLSDNTPTITAIANDTSYDQIYSKQLEIMAKEGDILIVFSGSGSSKNIINAITCVLDKKMRIIAVVGTNGGLITKNYTDKIDFILHIPVDMENYEDIQVTFCHLLKHLLSEDK